MFSKDKFCRFKNKKYLCIHFFRDVAQSGLEYSSGGRVVAGSNPVIPTTIKRLINSQITIKRDGAILRPLLFLFKNSLVFR